MTLIKYTVDLFKSIGKPYSQQKRMPGKGAGHIKTRADERADDYLEQFKRDTKLQEESSKELKVGDTVYITLEGLQKHSRSIPNFMGYQKETKDWRDTLSEMFDANIAGKVTRVFDKNIDIAFPTQEMQIHVPKYMVQKGPEKPKEEIKEDTMNDIFNRVVDRGLTAAVNPNEMRKLRQEIADQNKIKE